MKATPPPGPSPHAPPPAFLPAPPPCQDVENDKHADEVVHQLIVRLNASRLAPLPVRPQERCVLTRGNWCMQFHLQAGVRGGVGWGGVGYIHSGGEGRGGGVFGGL